MLYYVRLLFFAESDTYLIQLSNTLVKHIDTVSRAAFPNPITHLIDVKLNQ
jgi:hypothetical protein